MRAALVVLIALATACGRVGFDSERSLEDGGTAYPADITLAVRGGVDDELAGLPIANATVIFDDGDPQTLVTDAGGMVTATVDAAATIHVGYRIRPGMPEQQWRLYTLENVTGGSSLVLGYGRAVADFATITVTVPSHPAATRYQMHGPVRCGIDGSTTTTDVVSPIHNCTGESLPIYIVAYDNGGTPLAWLDAGSRIVLDGAMYTATTTWEPFVTDTIRYTQIPDDVGIYSKLGIQRGDERIFTSSDDGPAAGGDHDQLVATFGIPSDVMITFYQRSDSADLSGFLVDPIPPSVQGVRRFDASRLVQVIDTIVIDANRASWTVSLEPRSPTLQLVQVHYLTTDGLPAIWQWVTPGDVRALQIDPLPSPLDAVGVASALDGAAIALFATDGATYATALQTVLSILGASEVVDDLPVGWGFSIGSTGVSAVE